MTWTRPRLLVSALIAFARSEAASLAVISVIAGGILLFVAIADEMAEGDAHGFDMAVLQALHPGPDLRDPAGPAWLDHAAADFTSFGSISVIVTIALSAIGFLVLRRRALEGLLLAVALAGGLALSEGLKSFFDRARPPDVYRYAETLNPSFPSGHALLSAVLYLSLGAMLARATSNRKIRTYVMAVAILVTLLVGATRVYLGVHWVTDVLGGWCIGAAWAMAFWLFERWARGAMARRRGDQPREAARSTSTTA